MLLLEARRPARTDAAGDLVPLADQDRSRWNHALIGEGVALITDTMARAPVGPYQLQAAIAAVHDEAQTADATDWPQILALYELLAAIAPGPVVDLNRSIAVAMVEGPDAALALLDGVAADGRLAESHRVDAVRAHLLEMRGDSRAASAAYLAAARRTTSRPERRYLERRASRLEGG